MVRQLALSVAFVLVAITAGHAEPGKVVERMAPPLRWDRIGIAEGLPSSHVIAIEQDRLGFMWFGTEDGLARYDGIQMRVYRPRDTDSSSISSGYVTAIELDPSGQLWVGTAEQGLNLYDPTTDTFKRFSTGKGGLSSEGVKAIAIDPKGRAWFAMSGGGLDRYDAATGTFTEFLAKPLDTAITAIAADAKGSLWLGTAGDGVLRWNPDDNTSTPFVPPTDEDAVAVTALTVASTGKLWVGTDGNGLYEFDPTTHAVVRFQQDTTRPDSLSDDHVSALLEDRAHNVWAGTTSGLNRISPAGNITQFQHDPNDPTSMPSPGIESLYQDAGGVTWIGGFTAGLGKFDQDRIRFGHYRVRAHANSFFQDDDGTLWVGSYNDGLYKFERSAQRVTVYRSIPSSTPGQEPIALDSAWITAMQRDRRGTLWIALKGHGLIGFDTKTETYTKQYMPDAARANSLPVDTLFDIAEDASGFLWLASWGGGLVRFDPRLETFTAFTTGATESATGISSNYLYVLYADPVEKQVLWLGTAKGGVVRFDTAAATATNVRHKADDATSLSSDDVLSIYRDGANRLWLGTYGGGLDRLDLATRKVRTYTTKNSELTNDAVLGVLVDASGMLWLSTNGGGLVQLDPKTDKLTAYGAADGVQDNEFSQGSFAQGKNGELFFGGVNGFNAFVPSQLTRDAYVPPVVMTAFKLFNQEVQLGRPIWSLPPLKVTYADSFEVQFAALSFAAPGSNRYAYKLEGFDDKFIETNRPYATYTKLGGGKYTLRVRAATAHGPWNETGVALKLAVSPPLWRTWRAYGLYLLLLVGAGYLVYRSQRERVMRAEREGRLAIVERDLELTGLVQTGFLPENDEIRTPHVQVFGLYRPADACGGDWWWYEPMTGGRHVIMVGDVTGHGPGPAMVTAAVSTAFRVLMENGLDDIEHGLTLLNREVLRVAKGNYHMTMAALEIDENSGRWVLYSAGAPPILSLGQSGAHKVHFCAGAPLGTAEGFETGRVEGQLQPADRILMYTDGIPEIALPNGSVLGMRRFAQQYEQTRGQPLRDAATAIVRHADVTKGPAPQDDDWTFAMIEWN